MAVSLARRGALRRQPRVPERWRSPMWRWRDWVIDAFNRNMPFDRFTIEQFAGDMLPNPTLDQRIATGFNRNHRGNAEGGIIPEEYAVEYVVDRVDTTSTVLLGVSRWVARGVTTTNTIPSARGSSISSSSFQQRAGIGEGQATRKLATLHQGAHGRSGSAAAGLDRRLTAATDAFAALDRRWCARNRRGSERSIPPRLVPGDRRSDWSLTTRSTAISQDRSR